MNIAGLLGRHARYRPEHLALVASGRRLGYRELNGVVNRYANALLGLGLKKGERFMTLLPNGLDLMALYWAAAKSGLVIVPASTLLQEAGIGTVLRDSGARAVVALPEFHDSLQRIVADGRVSDRLVGSLGGVFRGPFTAGSCWRALPYDSEPVVRARRRRRPLQHHVLQRHHRRAQGDPHIATTCAPTTAPSSPRPFRMTPESLVLHAGSIVFNGAMIVLMPWMYLGCRYVLHDGFDPAAVLRDIEAEGATHMVMVPSQIIALLDHPDFAPEKLASLEMILSVGAPLLDGA